MVMSKLRVTTVTVLQFCALCCIHVACRTCSAQHVMGHPDPAGAGDGSDRHHWVQLDEDSTGESNGTEPAESDADAAWVLHAKIALMPIVFVFTLAASALPWYIRRLAKAIDILAIGACFTAGIILGVALSHIMVHANEAFTEYAELSGNGEEEEHGHEHEEGHHHHEAYPTGPAIAAAVLLLLVWIDSILVRRNTVAAAGIGGHSHGGTIGTTTAAENGHAHMVPSIPQEYHDLERRIAEDKAAKRKEGYGATATHPPHAAHGSATGGAAHAQSSGSSEGGDGSPSVAVAVAVSEPALAPPAAAGAGAGEHTAVHVHHPPSTGSASNADAHAHTSITVAGGDTSSLVEDKAMTMEKLLESMRGSPKQNAQAMIFLIALSVHSIFDGLSVGTEEERESFSALLIAILGHKLLDGFALGVPIYFARWSKRNTIAALAFSALMTPLGVGIAMAAHAGTSGADAALTRAVILSMSLGSFLFISLVELLPAGLDNGKHLTAKMGACLFGWGLMAIIAGYV